MAKKTEMKEVTKMKEATEIKSSQDLFALVARMDKGDPQPEDLKTLQREFDRCPELFRAAGNLYNHILSAILQDTNSSILVQKSIERYIKEMKTKLGYQNSTFVEQMLIDEIVMRWLRLQNMESQHRNVTFQSHSLEQGMYLDKRLDIAQKRFLRAMNTLVRVRKMIAQTQAKGAEMFKNLMKDGD